MGCRPKLPSSVWYIIFALSSSAFSLAFFLSFLLRCNCVKMLISPYVISVISKRQPARQQTADLGKRGRGRVGSGAAGQLEQLRQQLGHSSRLASSSSSRGLHTMACAWEKKWEDSQASSELKQLACADCWLQVYPHPHAHIPLMLML